MFRDMHSPESPLVLTQLALRTLEEAAAFAQQTALRSWGTRFALAYLGLGKPDRWAFDDFWKALAETDDVRRRAALSAALNAIYRCCGEVRG